MAYPGSQFHSGPCYLNNPLAALPDADPEDPFAEVGAQDALFLAGITSLEGPDDGALSAVVTGSITVPFLVEFLDPSGSGAIQTWVLQASTLATGLGVQRPNDYSDPANAKVWIQVS